MVFSYKWDLFHLKHENQHSPSLPVLFKMHCISHNNDFKKFEQIFSEKYIEEFHTWNYKWINNTNKNLWDMRKISTWL